MLGFYYYRKRGGQPATLSRCSINICCITIVQHFTCTTSLNYPANLPGRCYYYPHFTGEKTGHKRVKNLMFEVSLLVWACARTCTQSVCRVPGSSLRYSSSLAVNEGANEPKDESMIPTAWCNGGGGGPWDELEEGEVTGTCMCCTGRGSLLVCSVGSGCPLPLLSLAPWFEGLSGANGVGVH